MVPAVQPAPSKIWMYRNDPDGHGAYWTDNVRVLPQQFNPLKSTDALHLVSTSEQAEAKWNELKRSGMVLETHATDPRGPNRAPTRTYSDPVEPPSSPKNRFVAAVTREIQSIDGEDNKRQRAREIAMEMKHEDHDNAEEYDNWETWYDNTSFLEGISSDVFVEAEAPPPKPPPPPPKPAAAETERKEVESIITEMETQQTVINDTTDKLPGTSIDKDGYNLDAYSKFMPTVHSKGCLHFCKDIYGSPEITEMMCKRNIAIDRFQELEKSFNSKMMEIGPSMNLLSKTPLPQPPTLTPGQKQKWCNVCDIPSFMKIGARELNRR